MVAQCLSRSDKMKSNITFRNLTDEYGTCSEQDLSHISVPISSLLPPPYMHMVRGGDSGSFSPETPGCLALHKEHGASASIRVHMDGCRIF